MPSHQPAPTASATAPPPKTAVRRSSATVAAISGAMLNSDSAVRPVIASSRPDRISHPAAAASATCPADGRDLAVTPAPAGASGLIALLLRFTEFSARFGVCRGHVARRGEVQAYGRGQRRGLAGAGRAT